MPLSSMHIKLRLLNFTQLLFWAFSVFSEYTVWSRFSLKILGRSLLRLFQRMDHAMYWLLKVKGQMKSDNILTFHSSNLWMQASVLAFSVTELICDYAPCYPEILAAPAPPLQQNVRVLSSSRKCKQPVTVPLWWRSLGVHSIHKASSISPKCE